MFFGNDENFESLSQIQALSARISIFFHISNIFWKWPEFPSKTLLGTWAIRKTRKIFSIRFTIFFFFFFFFFFLRKLRCREGVRFRRKICNCNGKDHTTTSVSAASLMYEYFMTSAWLFMGVWRRRSRQFRIYWTEKLRTTKICHYPKCKNKWGQFRFHYIQVVTLSVMWCNRMPVIEKTDNYLPLSVGPPTFISMPSWTSYLEIPAKYRLRSG